MLNPSVSKITANLGKMVTQLRTHAEATAKRRVLMNNELARLSIDELAAADEQEKALRTADKIEALIA